MQRCRQGIDFLGSVVYPDHCLIRQRSIRALRLRLRWFEWLVFGHADHPVRMPEAGQWRQWLQSHPVLEAQGHPSQAMLKRMLSTINSYYGVFSHAHTHTLRKHIYEHELGRRCKPSSSPTVRATSTCESERCGRTSLDSAPMKHPWAVPRKRHKTDKTDLFDHGMSLRTPDRRHNTSNAT